MLAASTGADAAHTYETAWDRLRTFSLLAIADAALYNYNKNDDRLTGTSISFAPTARCTASSAATTTSPATRRKP